MLKVHFLLFFISFWTSLINGQTSSPAVTNVSPPVVSEERDKVTVTYDLARKPGVSQYNITVKITLDGELVNALALSGDIGPNVTPGYGKRIVWDVLKDLSELSGALKIEIISITNAPDCVPIKSVPVYAGLAGAGTLGLTLILSGLQMESESQELYDVYKTNLDLNDPIYQDELSREDYYQDANSKHKSGTWLVVGGSAVIVAGGILMVTRLIQINKYNKNCAGKTSDSTPFKKINPIVHVGGLEGVSTGIAITF